MGLGVEYYCPCLAATPHPPPPNLPSSSHSFHPLHNLFFCEECDAVRCNRCVFVEVSGYYCPNCLFEVPSASVRAEKNRCARNCFMCPNCSNTLTVVPSDPPDTGDSRNSPIVISTVGEPPFFLYCNHCRWDSAEVDITFEKPTGLAAQLQKFEDSAPESLEFERLKEHFEPFLRASNSNAIQPTNSSHHGQLNPIQAAASSALSRDIPGVSKYNPLGRSRSGREKAANRNEIAEYKARVEAGAMGLNSGSGAEGDVEFVKHLETVEEVAALNQRWVNSWPASLHTSDMKPLRIPLHSKKSKRCPSCRHILIKPEQKAQSVRYKIKLVAANYLPAISVSLPHAQAALEMMKRSAGRTGSAANEEHSLAAAGGMIAGKTYPFHLSFTNPLYDPIQVRLHVQRAVPPITVVPEGGKAPRAPFAVTLPSSAFPIAAYAEAWEYEDDEDMFGDEDDFEGARGLKDRDGRGKTRAVGVLERRANVTVVGGEIVLGKEAKGAVKFNMLVTYTYRSDDPEPEGDIEGLSPSKAHGHSKAPEMKTFSFYTLVELGNIIPREDPKMDL
ncbi:dynactin p62 [Cristinia sonorae]|uniref:Dynactin subunit 4 n=1 Tax=Cristinia sonorae TaxID=1940300 RepID=A0A8K0UPU1_9AGAR|nr:dynactin p62 [Cristinia sonorae]